MAKLDGCVALVTGSGRGIGQQVALQLAAEGAKVVVNDLDEAPAAETVEVIKSNGGEAVACVGSAMDNYGDIHIIVNNAGYTWDATIQKMSEKQFDDIMDVHLKAPWRILKEASEIIRIKSKEEAQKGERVMRKVVNISSTAGSRGNAGQTNYSSAKAALIGLSKTLSKEWGRYNVCVNVVAFGLIETRLTEATDEKAEIEVAGNKVGVGVPKDMIAGMKMMIPLGRAGTPAEAAGGIMMFCLPESDYVSGQLLEVTGGL
jgi:3-oxoacyl-[acyl-carrier protein] reductase